MYLGVPKETRSILKLQEAVDAFRIPTSGPLVVHCRYIYLVCAFRRGGDVIERVHPYFKLALRVLLKVCNLY